MPVECSWKPDLHEIYIGKKFVVCNFIMVQKLVVGRFLILKKLVGFYAVKGFPLDSNNHRNPGWLPDWNELTEVIKLN